MARQTQTLLSVPNELLFRIIGFNANDTPSLKSSSLVCTRLCSPSQSQLFSKITLDTEYKVESGHITRIISQTEDFFQLLSASPHIALYIRGLGLGSATFRDPALANVLSRLPRITSLCLFSSHEAPIELREVDWQSLPSSIMAAFDKHIFPSLQSLDLEVTSVPMSLLSRCPRLTEVDNFLSKFTSVGLPATPWNNETPSSLTKLSLSLAHPHGQISLLLNFILHNGCKITSLDLEIHSNYHVLDIEAISQLLFLCSSTLQTLQFVTINAPHCVNEQFGTINDTFNFVSFPALTEFVVSVCLRQSFDGHHDVEIPELEWLAERLQAVHTTSVLQRVIIDVWNECKQAPLFTLHGKSIDTALKSTHLRGINYLLIRCFGPSDFSEDVAYIFRRALPEAHSRGILAFEAEDTLSGTICSA